MDMPPGPSGKYVAIGATSLPWHISAKTKYPDVGAAFINWLIAAPGSAQLMYAQNQIPADLDARRPAKGNAVPDLDRERLAAARQGDGLTLFPDWASTNMLTVMGTEFQKMIAGRQSAGGHRQDDPERLDDVRQDAQVSEA